MAAMSAGAIGVAAQPASAVTSKHALIYGPSVTVPGHAGLTSQEAKDLIAQGWTVSVVSGAAWKAMTATAFRSYQLLVFGDAHCTFSSAASLATAVSNESTWAPLVNGNSLIIGTDPVYHYTYGSGLPGPGVLITHGLAFAGTQAGKTGLYLDLSCIYDNGIYDQSVPILNGLEAGFLVSGFSGTTVVKVATSPALAGVSSADLSTWHSSVHEYFASWPANYTPFAVMRTVTPTTPSARLGTCPNPVYTAPNGAVGCPYIVGSGTLKPFTTTSRPTRPMLKRVYGTDAIATAIAVAQHEYQTGGAGAVVLARTTFFSDALAGAPFAAAKHAPLLLTQGAPLSSTIDARVLAEIQRVLPKGGTIYILGGPLALSPNVDTTLQGLGYKTVRVAGANEYATAVDIAGMLGNPSTVFETTGLTFADSLSAGPAAIKTGGAILLTAGSVQSTETAAYLAAHPGDTRYAVGGPLAAYGADPSAIPVYGQTLFATSAAVAKRFFPGPSIFGVAAHWQDALAGGVFVGVRRGPLLIVPSIPPLRSPTVSYLSTLAGPQGYVFGGPLAIAQSVVTAVHAAEGRS
jgi:hypothetical protein